jgi:hypothetical protein
VKLRFSIALALSLTLIDQAGSAQSLDRMRQEGWQDVREGVLQRSVGRHVETFTYGEAGQRWTARRLKERIRSLQREYDRYPSTDLAGILKSLRRELASPNEPGEPFGLEELGACDPAYGASADAAPLLNSQAPGVTASASAYFHSPCSDVGNTYSYAYVRASVANTMTTRSQEDPESGSWVDSTASVSLSGTASCYSEAYARSWSLPLGINYEVSDTNFDCPAQTPYLGTPFAVPGTIPAIDFDNGGEGISYHEIWPELNTSYRATEVDHYRDIITQFDDGEWLEYTINVAKTGTYTLIAQIGAGEYSGQLHMEVDGADVTGLLDVPLTGGWILWGSVIKKNVQLAAGLHVLRVVADLGFEGFYGIRIVAPSGPQTPFGGTVRTLPGTLHIVDFDEGGEQVSYHDNSVGCEEGCSYRTADVDRWEDLVYHTSGGEWMEYTVDVTASGTYNLSVRVSAEDGGATFHVEFNGVDVTGPMTVPLTNSWAEFQTVMKTGVILSAGRKVMRIVIDDSDGALDAGTFDTLTVQP